MLDTLTKELFCLHSFALSYTVNTRQYDDEQDKLWNRV
jgi:hypothetical protein